MLRTGGLNLVLASDSQLALVGDSSHSPQLWLHYGIPQSRKHRADQ